MNSASVEAIISLIGKRILDPPLPTRHGNVDRTRDRRQAPFALAVDIKLMTEPLFFDPDQFDL
jgi:hypothetical protein